MGNGNDELYVNHLMKYKGTTFESNSLYRLYFYLGMRQDICGNVFGRKSCVILEKQMIYF